MVRRIYAHLIFVVALVVVLISGGTDDEGWPGHPLVVPGKLLRAELEEDVAEIMKREARGAADLVLAEVGALEVAVGYGNEANGHGGRVDPPPLPPPGW